MVLSLKLYFKNIEMSPIEQKSWKDKIAARLLLLKSDTKEVETFSIIELNQSQ